MTIPSLTGLQTALRGLTAMQEAIDTTGHNIANASTPGYTRERVDLSATDPMPIPGNSQVSGRPAELGTGVTVDAITRLRDRFMDIQYRSQNAAAGDSSTRSAVLDQVQSALSEPSDHGLASQLSAFWNAWSNLANSPGDLSARANLTAVASSLAQTFNNLDSQLSQVSAQAAAQLGALTSGSGQVAADAQQLAQLNGKISQALALGQTPNDLMDQRDGVLDDLSGLAKVQVTDPGNGLLQVSFGDASSPLVSGTTVTWPQTLSPAAGGKLGALLALSGSGGTIDTLRSSLDGVASQLMNDVNGAFGSAFFDIGNPQHAAATLAVDVNAPVALATTSNATAVAVSMLRGGQTDSRYAAFVSQVGAVAQAAKAADTTQQAVLSAVGNQRTSVSGVSVDEEMTNLITFQRGYQASARVMTTMDEMLDTLINRTGRAGL